MSCNVAFIGLGVMGYPMAGYISKGGHNVTVLTEQNLKQKNGLKNIKVKLQKLLQKLQKMLNMFLPVLEMITI